MLPKCHDHPWRKKSLEIYQWIELTTGLWISLQFYKSTKDAIPLPSFLKFYFVSLFYFLSCLENPSRSKLYLFILTYEAKNNYSLLSTLTALWLHLSLTYHCVTLYLYYTYTSLPVNFLMEKRYIFFIFYILGGLQLTNLICSFIYLLHFTFLLHLPKYIINNTDFMFDTFKVYK